MKCAIIKLRVELRVFISERGGKHKKNQERKRNKNKQTKQSKGDLMTRNITCGNDRLRKIQDLLIHVNLSIINNNNI